MFKDKCRVYTTVFPLQQAGYTSTFIISVLPPTSVFGALSLIRFDAFIGADALSWARKHSCNQTTQEFYLREKTEVFGM